MNANPGYRFVHSELRRWIRRVALPCALIALTFAPAVVADTSEASDATDRTTGAVRGSTLDVPRHVIANGGGRSAGGAWVIRGTVGQADADPLQPSTDGNGFYAITGGFWPALPAPRTDGLFIDGFEAQAD